MTKLQNILNILIAVLGFAYFYCVNNQFAEAKSKMSAILAKKSKSYHNKKIVEPPPIPPSRDWRITKRSMELDYHNTTNTGYKSHHKGQYNDVTDVARDGRKTKDLDPQPFVVESTEIILKIEIAGCIYAHNQIRRKHNLSILLWDTDLSYGAEEWALVLAARSTGTSKLIFF